jgi:hypothetical protein
LANTNKQGTRVTGPSRLTHISSRANHQQHAVEIERSRKQLILPPGSANRRTDECHQRFEIYQDDSNFIAGFIKKKLNRLRTEPVKETPKLAWLTCS